MLHVCMQAAFERVVLPAVDAFQPELILVSSGFDASFMVGTAFRMWVRGETMQVVCSPTPHQLSVLDRTVSQAVKP